MNTAVTNNDFHERQSIVEYLTDASAGGKSKFEEEMLEGVVPRLNLSGLSRKDPASQREMQIAMMQLVAWLSERKKGHETFQLTVNIYYQEIHNDNKQSQVFNGPIDNSKFGK